MKVCINS